MGTTNRKKSPFGGGRINKKKENKGKIPMSASNTGSSKRNFVEDLKRKKSAAFSREIYGVLILLLSVVYLFLKTANNDNSQQKEKGLREADLPLRIKVNEDFRDNPVLVEYTEKYFISTTFTDPIKGLAYKKEKTTMTASFCGNDDNQNNIKSIADGSNAILNDVDISNDNCYTNLDNNKDDKKLEKKPNREGDDEKEIVLRWKKIQCSQQYESDSYSLPLSAAASSLTFSTTNPNSNLNSAPPVCYPRENSCGRVLIDNFISHDDVNRLIDIAEILMLDRKTDGGPCIADINTGFVFDSDGLDNIYQNQNERRSRSTNPRKKKMNTNANVALLQNEDYILYHQITEKIRHRLMEEFQINYLHLTSPTFITRIIGNPSWQAKQVHDEYWHPHVDKNNTQHYDYSGLLYLSDYGSDFAIQKPRHLSQSNNNNNDSATTISSSSSRNSYSNPKNFESDGIFTFYKQQDPNSVEMIVEPKKGRALLFTAGDENLHSVNKLINFGSRYVLSFWFTCNPNREFVSRSSKAMSAEENNPNSLQFISSEYASKSL